MTAAVRAAAYGAGDMPPINRREVWRYAGWRGIPDESEEVSSLLNEVIAEITPVLTYRVCWCESELRHSGGEPVLPFSARSKNLSDLLRGCGGIVLFAVTVGIELDRRIAKYSRLSPSKALLLQAIGAERVEALADKFCREYDTAGRCMTRRYSPGYGDLLLGTQTELVRLLECEKRIGVTLNESLMMSPSKSVTAIFGLRREGGEEPHDGSKCAGCNNLHCEFRSVKNDL